MVCYFFLFVRVDQEVNEERASHFEPVVWVLCVGWFAPLQNSQKTLVLPAFKITFSPCHDVVDFVCCEYVALCCKIVECPFFDFFFLAVREIHSVCCPNVY